MSINETYCAPRVLVMALLTLTGCLSNREATASVWPPQDFYLEAEASRVGLAGYQVSQRLQIWADGLAVYQEADASVSKPGVGITLPVFRRMCAYQMGQKSIRALAREIDGLRVSELLSDQSAGGRSEGERTTVSVHWTGFGESKFLRAEGRARYPMARLLRVVNSFAPRQGAFALPRMGGEVRDRRVEQVPSIVEGADSCLVGYQRVLDRKPDNVNILLSAYALSLEGAGATPAKAFMDRLRAVLASASAEAAVFPEAGGATLVEELESFLSDS